MTNKQPITLHQRKDMPLKIKQRTAIISLDVLKLNYLQKLSYMITLIYGI